MEGTLERFVYYRTEVSVVDIPKAGRTHVHWEGSSTLFPELKSVLSWARHSSLYECINDAQRSERKNICG